MNSNSFNVTVKRQPVKNIVRKNQNKTNNSLFVKTKNLDTRVSNKPIIKEIKSKIIRTNTKKNPNK